MPLYHTTYDVIIHLLEEERFRNDELTHKTKMKFISTYKLIHRITEAKLIEL